MVKSKKSKKAKASNKKTGDNGTGQTTGDDPNSTSNNSSSGTDGKNNNSKKKAVKKLDDLHWLRECETKRDGAGEPYLQLEYQDDDALIGVLHDFLEESAATVQVVHDVYQIWQQTVLQTLLASTGLWKKEQVTAADQRAMKDQLKLSRYKINFIMHHAVGSMLTSPLQKWVARREDVLQLCYQTVQLLPRLAESCPHHPTDLRQTILHFEGKEFLAAAACETWDTLYDYAIPMDPAILVPTLRRCAMLDILDKDWNMLGGWEDILKGLEAKCCPAGQAIYRTASDAVLHEHTTILRNARNSMQCKFFSVRFMRYTEDQAPQRWRYFPKCSAPACAAIETAQRPHKYRCRTCWYFHYCSPACQEYCDGIMGLHPKFCKDTPPTKAALCRRETEQYLGWTSQTDNLLACQACGATEHVVQQAATRSLLNHSSNNNNNNSNHTNSNPTTADGSRMKRCQRCQRAVYCSKPCQDWDWNMGGHRHHCRMSAASQENATVVVVGAGVKELN